MIESGVGFAAAYPGTPSTEIVEALASIAKDIGLYVEWSTNEKVAFESAYAAALSGVKSFVAMKHVGLNVAADILMSSAYAGVNAGFVIVSADDPGQYSSQNEQDNRWYGMISHIPVVEPWSPRSAYRLVKEAYNLSEKYSHPVIFRSTTRISHSRQPVTFEQEVIKPKTKGMFDRDIRRYVLIPIHGRKLKKIMMEKWRKIQEEEGRPPLIEVINSGRKKAIIASGIAFAHVLEALEYLGRRDDYTILRVSLPVPLPYKPVLDIAKDSEKILIIEELDPIVEQQVRSIIQRYGLEVKVYGKEYVPQDYDLNVEETIKAIKLFEGEKPVSPWRPVDVPKLEPKIPPRPPVLCPGCPHRNTFYIVKVAANKAGLKNPVFTGDIGCYTLGYSKPFETQMTSFEMGGSIGVAHGLSKVIEDPVIAVIGDSTFYHAGLPPSINIVYNRGHVIILVLDNYYTAMTGHQPHPGTGVTAIGETTYRIPAEKLLEAMGFKTYVINPMNIREAINKVTEAYREYIKGRNIAIVSRLKCALQVVREARRKGINLPVYGVNQSKCTGCMACVNLLACPAIVVSSKNNKPTVIGDLCVGCGLCAQVCPFNAIEVIRQGSPDWQKLWYF